MPGLFDMLNMVTNPGQANAARNRHNIYNDKVTDEKGNQFVIDTCYTMDSGWETGVEGNSHWVVPERYKNEEEAKKGHEKWKKRMSKGDASELFDKIAENDLDNYLKDKNFEG